MWESAIAEIRSQVDIEDTDEEIASALDWIQSQWESD